MPHPCQKYSFCTVMSGLVGVVGTKGEYREEVCVQIVRGQLRTYLYSYPTSKQYSRNPHIRNEWEQAKMFLKEAVVP